MKLRQFPFLADENVQDHVVDALRSNAIDIASIWDFGLFGAPDEDVLAVAHREGRVVLTHDSDFGALVMLHRIPVVGVVYLRPGHISPAVVARALVTIIEQDLDFQLRFVMVIQYSAKDTVRVRWRQV